MDRLPSKTALLLARLFNITSLCLLFGSAAMFSRVIWPGWAGNAVAVSILSVLGLGFICYVLLHRKLNAPLVAMLKRHPEQAKRWPDNWQWVWMWRAKRFGFSDGEEWRPVQAVLLSFTIFSLTVIMGHWRWPEIAPNFLVIWPGLLCCAIVTASMCDLFSNDFTKVKKPQPPSDYRGPDDFGPVGVGARVRPPSPVLSTGNAFPEDDQHYA